MLLFLGKTTKSFYRKIKLVAVAMESALSGCNWKCDRWALATRGSLLFRYKRQWPKLWLSNVLHISYGDFDGMLLENPA